MTQSDNKKAPYKRGDIVQYKEGNGVALVVGMWSSKVAKINWIVVPTFGNFDNKWFFRNRHPECDFYAETDSLGSLGEVLCHVPMPEPEPGPVRVEE